MKGDLWLVKDVSSAAKTNLEDEIGENKEYQQYLIIIEQIKANQEVGVAQALSNASVKVLANSGDVTSGLTKVTDLFSSKGGVELGNMLEGLVQSEVGKNIVDKITGNK